MEPHEQGGDGDGDEGRAEGLADVPQRVLAQVRVAGGDRRVEPEELRDGDADGGEGEGGPEPCEEGAF